MLKFLFDGYAWKSRILVGVLTSLPLIIITPWAMRILAAEANPWLANPIIMAAVSALASPVVRQLGLMAEPSLLREWGGYPSTSLMRWRDGYKSDAWKKRFHALVKERLGIPLASPQEERDDPDGADARIADAFAAVRKRIWGKKDLPSHAANTDYGFARNLYGCTWLWLFLSAASTAALVIGPVIAGREFPIPETMTCALLTIMIPILEWWVIKPQARHCAYRYAEHAWESLVDLKDSVGEPLGTS
ncbi:MAG: hypothetical protein JW883_06570 [Deltaproteobacteria bacterium]|nr:hypothetical protein [Deltaproteobacteria bacterium]